MRAVIVQNGVLEVTDIGAPAPGVGQLLVQVERCGICGSDLHARTHADELAEVLHHCGYDRYMRSDERVVMGHEIAGTVTDLGPWSTGRIKIGTPVVSVPMVRRGSQVDGIGLSASAPGGYAEQVVLQESFTMPIPNGLSFDIAALTEPMAVGWHAVNAGDVTRKDVAVVLGCGPVGLAVIAVLRARGVQKIIASDFSAGRRSLAAAMGAHVIVDPSQQSPWEAAGHDGFVTGMPQEVGAGMDAMEGMLKLPLPWWQTWRGLQKAGATAPKRPVVFECVGVPGMLDGIMAEAPLHSRIVVVGVCMGEDRLRPSLAVNKQLELRFVVGYTPLEFHDTLTALAHGKLDALPIVTGHVGLDGIPGAFDALSDPETHAKILIDPAIAAPGIHSRASSPERNAVRPRA